MPIKTFYHVGIHEAARTTGVGAFQSSASDGQVDQSLIVGEQPGCVITNRTLYCCHASSSTSSCRSSGNEISSSAEYLRIEYRVSGGRCAGQHAAHHNNSPSVTNSGSGSTALAPHLEQHTRSTTWMFEMRTLVRSQRSPHPRDFDSSVSRSCPQKQHVPDSRAMVSSAVAGSTARSRTKSRMAPTQPSQPSANAGLCKKTRTFVSVVVVHHNVFSGGYFFLDTSDFQVVRTFFVGRLLLVDVLRDHETVHDSPLDFHLFSSLDQRARCQNTTLGCT
jgi:hypothetical protein